MHRVLSITSSSLTLLGNALDEWRTYFLKDRPYDETVFNDKFKYKHAANIHDLMNDMLFMYQNKRLRGLRMLARPVVESFFSLCASYQVADFPLTKTAFEFRDHEKRVRLWNDLYKGGTEEARVGDILMAEAKQHLTRLEAQFGIIPVKDWATYNVAMSTRYPNQYRAAYFTYSLWTHCTWMSLETTGNISEADETIKAMTGFLIMTIGELRRYQPFAEPDKLFFSFDTLLEKWVAISHPN